MTLNIRFAYADFVVRARSRGKGVKTAFTLTDIPSPVSDRQANVVQASSSDSREIRFSDPLPSINAQKHGTHTENPGEEKEKRRNYVSNHIVAKLGQRRRAYSVPVRLKNVLGDRARLELTESPFVDDVIVAGVVEKTGSYPRLT